jgi:hypothetical protein
MPVDVRSQLQVKLRSLVGVETFKQVFDQANQGTRRTFFENKKLEPLLEQHKLDPTKLILSQSHITSNSKANYCTYEIFNNYNEAIKLIAETHPQNRTFNEVITLNQATKMQFDAEWLENPIETAESERLFKVSDHCRREASYTNREAMLVKLKTHIGSLCLQLFGKPLTEDNFLLLDSSRWIESPQNGLRYFKNSIHLILINYGRLPNLVDYHKRFVELLVESFHDDPQLTRCLMLSQGHQERLDTMVDTGIYTKNRNLRCVLCTKPKKDSPLLPNMKDSSRPISDFFWGWTTAKDPDLNTSWMTGPIIKQPKLSVSLTQRTISSQQITNLGGVVPSHLVHAIETLLSRLSPARAMKYDQWTDLAFILYSIHPCLYHQFDQWSQSAPNYDLNSCQRLWSALYQSKYNLASLEARVQEDNKGEDVTDIHVHCGYTFKYLYQNTPRPTLEKLSSGGFQPIQHHINSVDLYVNLDLNHLIDEMVAGSVTTIVIKSPCGSAKTDFLVKLVTLLWTRQLIPNHFLLISALRSLALSLQGRFMGDKKPYGWTDDDPDPKSVNLKFYQEVGSWSEFLDSNMNIVINSLPKLLCLEDEPSNDYSVRDLIIIDEWKSFLQNLCGQTLAGTRRQIISLLASYLRKAKYVIVLDQNIDDDCLELLLELRDPKTTQLHEFIRPNACHLSVYELNDLKKYLEILDVQYLSQKKLVYICSNSKKNGADFVIQYIKAKYPEYQIQAFTSDTPESEKIKLLNCEDYLNSYFIASPTIVYGVDHSKPDVYHATFCIMSGYTIPTSQIIQQMKRVRQLIDNRIYICNLNHYSSETSELTPGLIDDQIRNRLKRTFIMAPTPKTNSHLAEFEANDHNKEKVQFERFDYNELASMVIQTTDLDGLIQPPSWFSKVYRSFMKTELEGRQNALSWIRGYLCQTGVQYYSEDKKVIQPTEASSSITGEIVATQEKVLEVNKQKYFDAPNYSLAEVLHNSQKQNPYGVAKTWHLHSFGFKQMSDKFYDQWIGNNYFNHFRNLIFYLRSDVDMNSKLKLFLSNDHAETERLITTRKLVNRLCQLIEIDIQSLFFATPQKLPICNRDLNESETAFIEANRKDLRLFFGDVARLRKTLVSVHELYRFVSRILFTYLGIELDCTSKKQRLNGKNCYIYSYCLTIPDEFYELISYRVIAHRHENLQWLFSDTLCEQLKAKFEIINRRWSDLSMYQVWPDSCLL